MADKMEEAGAANARTADPTPTATASTTKKKKIKKKKSAFDDDDVDIFIVKRRPAPKPTVPDAKVETLLDAPKEEVELSDDDDDDYSLTPAKKKRKTWSMPVASTNLGALDSSDDDASDDEKKLIAEEEARLKHERELREQKRKELLARFSEQPKPLVTPSPAAAPYVAPPVVPPPPEPEEEPAVEDDAARDQIVVKIRDPTGKVRKIKILVYDVFEKLYDYFSRALQAEPETVFLKRDGLVVKPSDTPWMIKLGRDETLDVVIEEPVEDDEEAGREDKESEPEEEQQNFVKLKVRAGPTEADMHYFRLSPVDPLSKVHAAFCARLGLDAGRVQFMVDGDVVNLSQSADDLDLENDDVIDAAIR